MKKIISGIIFLFVCASMPFIADAQATNGTCTGEIRTDMVAAQDCAAKATAQGQALGYTISREVIKSGLGGFVDPLSGKDYILSTVCTVNGSTGHGAELLAGFTAAASSNAIVRNVNPGWDILKTELAYEGAFSQCGGKAPYYVNGGYTCTPPPGALISPTPVNGSTKTSDTTSGTAIANQTHQAIFASITQMVRNILQGYDDYTRSTLGFAVSDALNASSTSSTNTNTNTSTNPQCYAFTSLLQVNSTGREVFALTYALKHEGFLSQTTDVFDTNVMVAVKRFQEAHATEILSVLGFTQGTGVVAEKTRAYLNSRCIVPASVVAAYTPGGVSNSCPLPVRSGIKNGKYVYMFKQNTSGTWTITINNLDYSTPSDPYYVPAFFSFTATDAADLNRQNQGRFNYLSTLPGNAVGNTEYSNIFGSFNNAYYDWSEMTKAAPACTKP